MACNSPDSLGLAQGQMGEFQLRRQRFAVPAPEVWVISSTTILRLQFTLPLLPDPLQICCLSKDLRGLCQPGLAFCLKSPSSQSL